MTRRVREIIHTQFITKSDIFIQWFLFSTYFRGRLNDWTMVVYPFGFNTVIAYHLILTLFSSLLFAGSLGANMAHNHYLVVSWWTILSYKAFLTNFLNTFPR